jgi:hypothetical protein
VTARPVAPVIPAANRGRLRLGKPGAGRPMPLASPPGRPDVVYGFGRIDASGRVADRVTIAVLGWRGGDRLTLTADAGVMTARRDPGGMVTVPARPYVVIPAALRRRCGLRAAGCGLVTTCCWPPRLARTRWPRTHSRWWTRRCGRIPRPPAKGGGHDRHEPGRLPASCRGGSAGTSGADGPDPRGPDRRPAAPP